MGIRGVCCICIGLAVALPVLAPGAWSKATTAETRVELARETVIVGKQSSYLPVSIPQRATLSSLITLRSGRGPTKSIDIEGRGRLVGVAITQDPPTDDLSGNFLLAGRFALCHEQGCVTRKDRINFSFPGVYSSGQGESTVTLHPGNYRLYLLADGEPVKATMRIRGLSGSRVLRPSIKAPADFRTPDEALVADTMDPYYAAGDIYEAGVRGLILSTVYMKAYAKQDYRFGICHQGLPPPLPPEAMYGPQCSALSFAGGGAGAFGTYGDTKGFSLTFLTNYTENSFPKSPDGRAGLGGWISTDGEIKRAGFHGLFLSWDG